MRSPDGAWRRNVGGVQTLQFLSLAGLLQQRLSSACRWNSSTTRDAERSSECRITHNAVYSVEPQLSMRWLSRLCTAYYLTLPLNGNRNINLKRMSQSDINIVKGIFTANSHQRLLEVTETLLKCRSWLKQSPVLVGSDIKIPEVPTMANEHQHVFETMIIH